MLLSKDESETIEPINIFALTPGLAGGRGQTRSVWGPAIRPWLNPMLEMPFAIIFRNDSQLMYRLANILAVQDLNI
jgi:hypothetical protein